MKQVAVEKEKKLCGEHKECYEALEKRHAALLEECAGLKIQVHTLKYNLSQHEKGIPPPESNPDESKLFMAFFIQHMYLYVLLPPTTGKPFNNLVKL